MHTDELHASLAAAARHFPDEPRHALDNVARRAQRRKTRTRLSLVGATLAAVIVAATVTLSSHPSTHHIIVASPGTVDTVSTTTSAPAGSSATIDTAGCSGYTEQLASLTATVAVAESTIASRVTGSLNLTNTADSSTHLTIGRPNAVLVGVANDTTSPSLVQTNPAQVLNLGPGASSQVAWIADTDVPSGDYTVHMTLQVIAIGQTAPVDNCNIQIAGGSYSRP